MGGNFWEKIEKFKLPIALSLVGVVLMVGGIFASGLTKSKPKEYPKESLVESQKTISVDVSGAVQKSGVYQLKDGARVEDVIAAAGGFDKSANQEYISKYLNMAQKLSDGSKVYIPSEGEPISPAGVQGGSPRFAGEAGVVAGTNAQSKVNINTATQPELEALPAVGSVTASKIISGRPYQQVGDLSSRKIVSKSVFEKIKDLVVVY